MRIWILPPPNFVRLVVAARDQVQIAVAVNIGEAVGAAAIPDH